MTTRRTKPFSDDVRALHSGLLVVLNLHLLAIIRLDPQRFLLRVYPLQLSLSKLKLTPLLLR
jgi:hypothetical protein